MECDAAGGWWVHLRRCARCGHIGCSDSSPAQHASANYRTEEFYEGPQLADPQHRPVDVPGPAGRVPAEASPTRAGSVRPLTRTPMVERGRL